MKKVWKRVGVLTLAGVLAMQNPIATVPGIIGNESTVTVHASCKNYDSFSDILDAVEWGAGFYKSVKSMYEDKSKVNHVHNVSTIANYYYKSNKDIGKAISKMIKNDDIFPVDLGIDKDTSKKKIRKVITAYLIGCLGEYQYIQESGILSGIIYPMEKTKNLGYAFVYTGDYILSHKEYTRKNNPYKYMATHTEWARKAAASGRGTGYLDKQNFKHLKDIVENAIDFLY